jgi:Bacteriophage replication gene A protein (GPA).
MTRIRGFEEVATQMGHAGEFYTITSPSKMHAVLSSGKPNPKFNDSTPQDVNEYLNNIWKLIRSALHKKVALLVI